MTAFFILCAALFTDMAAGEMPNRFHPVAWLGGLISWQMKLAPAMGKARCFLFGMAVVILTTGFITAGLYLIASCLQQFNTAVYVIFSTLLLKSSFSLRGLWQAVENIRKSLASSDIDAARSYARALVSRDTGSLSGQELISATIESCSENLCDSFVAPLFYFAIFGLPGAIAYRILNTYDAMIGYHGKWEYTGKFAARLDDAANFIPARLSGLLIVIASALTRSNAPQGWQTMLSQHGSTESPNAGWPMGAMAGSLGITLSKKDHYMLDGGSGSLTVGSIDQAQLVTLSAASIWIVAVLICEVLNNAKA
jgi:adenosylcobinamide-phosphate synthase